MKQSSQRSAISSQLKTKTRAAPNFAAPDCMYWLKHDEAAILLAIAANCRLIHEPALLQKSQHSTVRKFARQWFKYQKDTEAAPARVVVGIRKALVKLARSVKR